MTTTNATGSDAFLVRTRGILEELEATGQMKRLQMIEGPMGPRITLRDRGEVDCFCSNNYLGLANHPTSSRRASMDCVGMGRARHRSGSFVGHSSRMSILNRRLPACLESKLPTRSCHAGRLQRRSSRHCVSLGTRSSRMS